MANVEGRNPVNELLNGKRKVKEVLLQRDIHGKIINKIKEKAKKNNISIKEVSKKHLDNIAESYAHQGVIAKAEEINLVSPEDIVEYAQSQDEPPFIIILDQVQDPHN